eukprot:contig_15918_g3820
MLSLQPGPYFNNADAYNSVRFVMAAQEAVGVSLGGVSPFSSFSGVTESHMDDEDVEAMRLLPTKEQLRRERRLAIDAPDRVARFLLTRTALREILRWDYLVASSTAGIRRYRTAAGEEKRLRAHTNHYWDAKAGLRDDDDLSADEDDGVFVSNLNAEYDGCYTPRETDPARIDELLRQSWSYLEDNDGGRALQVLAVGSSCLAVPPLSLCGHGQPTFLCYGGRSP